MKRPFLLVLFLLGFGFNAFSQPNFLVSCPSEVMMNGLQNYYFVSHQSYLIYTENTSMLKVIVRMNELEDKNSNPLPSQEIEYNTNIEDTNSLIFEGSIDEKKLRPDKLQDAYTFMITGNMKFRGITYVTEVICSYGARMIQNSSQISINLRLEVRKMEIPMYIPLIKQTIDNIELEIVDGTVNMIQN